MTLYGELSGAANNSTTSSTRVAEPREQGIVGQASVWEQQAESKHGGGATQQHVHHSMRVQHQPHPFSRHHNNDEEGEDNGGEDDEAGDGGRNGSWNSAKYNDLVHRQNFELKNNYSTERTPHVKIYILSTMYNCGTFYNTCSRMC